MRVRATVALAAATAALFVSGVLGRGDGQTPIAVEEGPVHFKGHALFRLHPRTHQHTATLQRWLHDEGADFWSPIITNPSGDAHVDLRITPEQRVAWAPLLADMGAHIVVPDVQALVDAESTQTVADVAGVDPFLTKYHTFDEILEWTRTLVAAHPTIASMVEVGKTYEGRTMWGVRISGQASSSDGDGDGERVLGKKPKHPKPKPTPPPANPEPPAPGPVPPVPAPHPRPPGAPKLGFVFHGGQHAREWISVAVSVWSLHHFVTNYGVDPEVTRLVDAFEFTIIPVMNVDGYIFSHEHNRMWRKNRQPPSDGGGLWGCVGTDTNRNWDLHWGEQGSSSNPCSEAFQGDGPFSTPEPKAVADYLLSRKAAGVDVKVYIDFHAYSQLWMSPWGYTCDDPTGPDAAAQLEGAKRAAAALEKVNGKKFAAGPICQIIYPASGSSTDWAYGAANVTYAYGVELRDTGDHGFILPPAQIEPSARETLAAIEELARFVLEREGA